MRKGATRFIYKPCRHGSMKKSCIIAFMCVFCLCFIMASVAATLTIDPLQPVYNIGDDMAIKLVINKGATTYGFVSILLSCSNGEVELYRAPLQVKRGEQRIVSIPTKLDRYIIGDLKGNCTLRGSYSDENAQSQPFEITSEIVVALSVPDVVIEPGTNITIGGKAIKRSGKSVDGIAQISIPELQLEVSAPVRQGAFNGSLTLPLNAPARTYTISAMAGEYGATAEALNEGTGSASFRVPQIPTVLEIAVNSITVSPGTEIMYTAVLTDQAAESIAADSVVSITTPKGERVYHKIISTNKAYAFPVLTNATPGAWNIQATRDALRHEKIVTVEELSNISLSLVDGILIVKNTGNVPYQRQLEVAIGDAHQVFSVAVDVGESQRFKLFAPEGSYPIAITMGNFSSMLGSAFLTGNAIAIKNADSGLWGVSPWLWWMIVILIVAIIAFWLYLRVRRGAYWARTPHLASERSPAPALPEAVNPSTPKRSTVHAQESGKYECSIVAVSVKNYNQLASVSNNPALDAIAHIVTQAINAKAKVYNQGTTKVMIFSPQVVGNPALSAALLAKSIEKTLLDYNLRYALKISFGIGIHTGMMIVEMHDEKPKFTSVGTSVVTAKKLAEEARNETIISTETHRTIGSKVKATKMDEKRWRLNSAVQRGENSEFIKRFMHRHGTQ